MKPWMVLPRRTVLLALVLAALSWPALSQSTVDRKVNRPTAEGTAPSTALTIAEPFWDSLEGDWTSVKEGWAAALREVAADLGPAYRLDVRKPLPEEDLPARWIRTSFSGSPDAYYAVFAVVDPALERGPMRYATFTKTGGSPYLELARMLESLARALEPPQNLPAPLLVDAFSPAEILSADLPGIAYGAVAPYGLEARRDGTLVVALGSTVLELGPAWQVVGQPTRKLLAEGQLNYAYSLALSPSGTLYVRSADGASTFAFPEGNPNYQKARLEASAGSQVGVLGDGSLFVLSLNPRSVKVFSPGKVVDFPQAPDAVVFAAAAGPEGTLWLADSGKGSIRILSGDGKLLRDILYPDLPLGVSIMRLKVLEDGSFLAITTQDLRRFDARGRLLWVWDGKAEGLALQFSYAMGIAQAGPGLYCLADMGGKRLIRLAEPGAPLPGVVARLASGPGKASVGLGPDSLLLDLADLYEAAGGLDAAHAALSRYLEAKPAASAVAQRNLSLEADLSKGRLAEGEAEVYGLLKRYGAEMARDAYTRVMKGLEGLHALVPDDDEVVARLSALKKAFREAETGTLAPPPKPKLARAELGPLFPSLLRLYATEAAGHISVKNVLSGALTDLRAEVYLPKYMDFPAAGSLVGSLAPGAEATLDLKVLLNDKVLEVEEDLPLQAQIRVRYLSGGAEGSVETTVPVLLLRRTALSWEDTARLACFITPNDESVSRLAFSILAAANPLGLPTAQLERAAALCDALGSLPLHYVPDPQSPITKALGKADVLDTVRFPRTTLAYQGGDCDDTTALLASLLESVGVATAILTSPGHVFLACDAGLPPEAAWLLSGADRETLVDGGKLWVPLESTDLGKGFAESWRVASDLVRANRGGRDFSLLPLAAARERYPALPLPPSTLAPTRVDEGRQAALAAQDGGRLDSQVYRPLAAAQDARYREALGAGQAQATKEGNRLARIQSAYGHDDLAILTLRSLVEKYPAYLPAYLNLAVLAAGSGKPADASSWLARASLVAPGSAAVGDYARRLGLAGPGPAAGQGGLADTGTKPGEGLEARVPAIGPTRAGDATAPLPWSE